SATRLIATASLAAGGIVTSRHAADPIGPSPPNLVSTILVIGNGVYGAPPVSPGWPPEYQPARSATTSVVPTPLNRQMLPPAPTWTTTRLEVTPPPTVP